MADAPAPPASGPARQKAILATLGVLLIAAGLIVTLFLKRIPLPLRLLVGFGDTIAGCVLLLLVRQKFNR